LLVDDAAAAGTLARRATAFAEPPTVWRVDDTVLTPAVPEPLPPEPAVDPRVAALADVIRAGGADPVVEHGVLRGEVLGLEVARAGGPRRPRRQTAARRLLRRHRRRPRARSHRRPPGRRSQSQVGDRRPRARRPCLPPSAGRGATGTG